MSRREKYSRMRNDRRGRNDGRWPYSLLWVCLLLACLWFSLLPLLQAAPGDHSSDNQVRQAVKQAVELAHAAAVGDETTISERNDLDEELAHITQKTTSPISFYSLGGRDASSDEGSVWALVSGSSALGSYELYSFESSDGVEQSAQKFNRLLSHLAPSISNEQSTSMARFFLGCCVRGAPGEIISNERDLHHSVERYYIEIYGDLWRALEAGSEWWEGYKKTAVEFTPTAVVEGDVRRISLKRLVLNFGMHPQLQQWDIAVSLNGSIRVLAVVSIFPKQERWLSYAFRSTIPQIR